MRDDASVELVVLRKLHEAVKAMFAFSGWEDGVDKDAEAAAIKVRRMVEMIDDIDDLIFDIPPATPGEQQP